MLQSNKRGAAKHKKGCCKAQKGVLQSTKRGAAKHINSKIVVCVQVNMDDADDVRCSELHVFNCSLFFVHYAELIGYCICVALGDRHLLLHMFKDYLEYYIHFYDV